MIVRLKTTETHVRSARFFGAIRPVGEMEPSDEPGEQVARRG
jgi:hypothetical protein